MSFVRFTFVIDFLLLANCLVFRLNEWLRRRERETSVNDYSVSISRFSQPASQWAMVCVCKTMTKINACFHAWIQQLVNEIRCQCHTVIINGYLFVYSMYPIFFAYCVTRTQWQLYNAERPERERERARAKNTQHQIRSKRLMSSVTIRTLSVR